MLWMLSEYSLPMGHESNTIELVLGSNLAYVELIQTVTDSITTLMGYEQEMAYWIGMSVRESAINAIKHGNRMDPGKKVEIQFLIETEQLIVFVLDEGEGFCPEDLPDPLAAENLLKPSGRGIFYMRSFMDEVIFTHRPNGGMQVQMIKRLSPKKDD